MNTNDRALFADEAVTARQNYVDQIARRLWQTSEGANDQSGWYEQDAKSRNFWIAYAEDVADDLMLETVHRLLLVGAAHTGNQIKDRGGVAYAPHLAADMGDYHCVLGREPFNG